MIANTHQNNTITPANDLGDACDDTGNDGIADLNDNCPSIPNRNQRDSNGDGDVCDHDTDTDGDGRNDAEDACPTISDTNCQAVHSIANLTMMIGDDPNGYFRLADDMMMNTSWASIASFTGTLDGDNYTISNLSAPLFGQIGRAATVTRIGIIGNVLARGNQGTIAHVYAMGNHSCSTTSCTIGGLFGENYGSITNSYAISNSRCDGENCFSGGLVGFNSGAITKSYAIGNSVCNATSCVSGGLVGQSVPFLGTIADAYAAGNSTCSGRDCTSGGLVGQNSNTVTNSYALGKSMCSGASCRLGGLVGQNLGTITASYRVQNNGTDGGTGDSNRILAQLQCPTYPGERCLGERTYAGWDNRTWHFGDNSTLPILISSPACPRFLPACRH